MQKDTIIYDKDVAWHGILHQIYVCLKQEYKAEKRLGIDKFFRKTFKKEENNQISLKSPREFKSWTSVSLVK